MCRKFSTSLVLALFAVAAVAAKNLPSFVKTCKWKDPELSKCFTESVIALRPYLVKGIPEMGLPPVDPLTIPKIDLQTGNGTGLNMDITLTDLMFAGGINFEMKNVDIVLESGKFNMEVVFPNLKMTSNYKAKGRVLVVELDANGKAHGEFGDVRLISFMNTTKILKNGKEHFLIGGRDIKVDVGSIKLRLDDLFKNNQELTDNTNRVIAENIDSLYPEFKPIVEQTLTQIFVSFVDSVTKKFPLEELYPMN